MTSFRSVTVQHSKILGVVLEYLHRFSTQASYIYESESKEQTPKGINRYNLVKKKYIQSSWSLPP